MITFPEPPERVLNYIFTAAGKSWQWNGVAWLAYSSGSGEGGSVTAHKSSHATGGADALTPADIGAATAAQGTKADTALQAPSLNPYRTSADQDNLSIALSIAL